jgi:hypothetical protein
MLSVDTDFSTWDSLTLIMTAAVAINLAGVAPLSNTFPLPLCQGLSNFGQASGAWKEGRVLPLYDRFSCPFLNYSGHYRSINEDLKGDQPENSTFVPSECKLSDRNIVTVKTFLRRMENRTIIFAGDSVTYEMLLSFACMLHTCVAPERVNIVRGYSHFYYRFDVTFALEKGLLGLRLLQIRMGHNSFSVESAWAIFPGLINGSRLGENAAWESYSGSVLSKQDLSE